MIASTGHGTPRNSESKNPDSPTLKINNAIRCLIIGQARQIKNATNIRTHPIKKIAGPPSQLDHNSFWVSSRPVCQSCQPDS